MVEFRVAHRHALWHKICWLVVVGNNNVDTLSAHHFYFGRGSDAIVYRNNEIGVTALNNTLKSLSRKAITLAKTARNVGINSSSQIAQSEGK